jgi:hypothetical protein
MPIDGHNRRERLAALGIIALVMMVYFFAVARPAHAQIAVTDPPVEAATTQTASELNVTNKTLIQNLQENTQTAQSVTTGGGAGAWQSNANYLASLASNLNGGINSPGLFNANFPGWLALPPNSSELSKQVSAIALRTYAGALAAAQQQVSGFAAEDSHLSGIEQTNQSITTVLQGQQLIVETMLALCQQVQLERQLLATQITLEATNAGEELDERTQQQATIAASDNLGVQP